MSEPIDGWYLMTTDEIVREAKRWRSDAEGAFRGFETLSIDDALRIRDAGNIPDDRGRSLRLVITVTPDAGVDSVSARRLEFEPDFHEEPTWRREGSKPVNVVPLRRRSEASMDKPEAWWEDAKVAPLEKEWVTRGTISGLSVPGEFRSFVIKTVIALQGSGHEVTEEAVLASVSRWLEPTDVERLRRAFGLAND